MGRKTELVSILKENVDDPRYATCYGRGSKLKKSKKLFMVEKGSRTVVSRTLCVIQFYGRRCKVCPNANFTVTFRSNG